ncbi:MAG TPA: hypothetical protein VK213_05480 [Bacteroidales bacterium]|nr:hypothetical protein [Bacteroidales bacterium]
MKLLPLYYFGNSYLICLDADLIEEPVEDILVVEADTGEKIILKEPWSLQKKLKFGYYYSIKPQKRDRIMAELSSTLGKNLLIEIEDKLRFPDKNSIDSLIWKSERIKKLEE